MRVPTRTCAYPSIQHGTRCVSCNLLSLHSFFFVIIISYILVYFAFCKSHLRASQVAQAEGRAEAAVRHSFEAMQLAERNAEKLEENEQLRLQTLGAFLTSGIVNMPPAAEQVAGSRRNRAGTPAVALQLIPVLPPIAMLTASISRCRQLRVHRVAIILRNR